MPSLSSRLVTGLLIVTRVRLRRGRSGSLARIETQSGSRGSRRTETQRSGASLMRALSVPIGAGVV
jgi:hypothetical protein